MYFSDRETEAHRGGLGWPCDAASWETALLGLGWIVPSPHSGEVEGTGSPQTDELILGQLQRLLQKGHQALGFLVGWL